MNTHNMQINKTSILFLDILGFFSLYFLELSEIQVF